MMFEPPAVHWFWIFWMGVIVLVGIAILIYVVRGLSGPRQQTFPVVPPSETPLDILARRFAKGEITAEEYQKGRDLLGGGGSNS